MKNTILICVFCFFTLNCIGQITIDTTRVTIVLPNKTIKVLERSHFFITDSLVQEFEKYNSKFSDFDIDGQYLDLNIFEKDISKDRLYTTQQGQINRRKRLGIKDTYYESVIKKRKNYDIFISKSKNSNYCNYYFFIVNKSYNCLVTGELKFLPNDETKARKNLDKILRGIKFKQ